MMRNFIQETYKMPQAGASVSLVPWSINGFFRSLTSSALSAMASFGVGEIFQIGSITKFLGNSKFFFQAVAHGVSQGALSTFLGGDFWSSALSASFASVSNDLLQLATANSGEFSVTRSKGFALANGAVSGGIGSVLGGGNFWQGAGQGLIVTAFNFLAHKPEGPGDPPGENKTPGDAVKGYLNSIKQDVIDGFANFGDALDMTGDWFTGSGSSNRTISTGRIVNSLKDAPAVERARDYWYAKADRLNSSKVQVTGYAGKFGLKGLVNSGFSPFKQFIGSMSINIYSDGSYLTFKVMNKTCFKSFFYQAPVPSWSRSTIPIMGNMQQVYTWREKIYK